MALTIICPFDAGFLDERRCEEHEGKCIACTLKWLQEESL
jgi:hypothetical protein